MSLSNRTLLVVVLACCVLLLVQARRRSPPSLHGLYVTPHVVESGQGAQLFVSSKNPQVEITITDQVADAPVWVGIVDGTAQPTSSPAHLGAGWTRSEPLPALPPGVYQVSMPSRAVADDQRLLLETMAWGSPLIVRPPAPSGDVLLVWDNASSQAYNNFGFRSYYTDPPVMGVGRLRPGHNSMSLRHLTRLATELDGLGLSWDAADSEYVEEHPGLLSSYRLVVLVGKYEYLTRPVREEIQAYFDAGGRVLALGLEFAVFQSRREGDEYSCYKFVHRGDDPVLLDGDGSNDHLASYEWARVGEPATRLFGTSFWLGGRPGVDTQWTVHRDAHWIWNGTGFSDGDGFGHVRASLLVDGTFVRFESGLAYPDQLAQTETPPDFLVLATVPTINARPWWCWLQGVTQNSCAQPGWGVIGIRGNGSGGILLVVPDAYWLRDENYLVYPELPQMTRNMLDVLGGDEVVDPYAGYPPTAP
jgi:hypothetical protein